MGLSPYSESSTATFKPLISRTTSKSSETTTLIRSLSTDATTTSAEATAQSPEVSDPVASHVPEAANKTIIVPVGIPGCGKTSVSVALAHIFGFGHVEHADTYGNYATFIKNVFRVLSRHDVVIADRTNHLKEQRRALQNGASKSRDSIRLLALNWSHNQPPATIHRICSDRVEKRGDKHQHIRADPSSKSHEDVIQSHISITEELTPSEVNTVVEMELGESLEESVKRAVEGCVAVLGLEMPSDEKIQEGLEKVKNYVPGENKLDELKEKKLDELRLKEKKKPDILYYRLLPEMNLEALLDRTFANQDGSNGVEFWTQLKRNEKVQVQPQVTIAHKDTIDTDGDLWNRCAALVEMSKASPSLFKVTLGHVLWNGRVMAITVDGFDVASPASGSDEAREVVANLSDEVRSRLLIVAGKENETIKAIEAKAMVRNWRRGEELDNINSIKLADEVVFGNICEVDRSERKKREVRCYTLLPELNLEKLLDRTLANEDKSIVDFWTQLKKDERVHKRPHATIIHQNGRVRDPDLWNRCVAVGELSMSADIPPLFKATLGHVLSDGRSMVVTLDDIDVATSGGNEGRELVSNLSDDVRSRIHILAGAKDKDVELIEARRMVQKWRGGEDLDKIKSIKVADGMVVFGKITGYKPFHSRRSSRR